MYTLHLGNCLHELRNIPENSIDSVVCDPPYELGFMSAKWDQSGIAYSVEMWKQALRVLKPGGHLLAFSGSRTYHRMTCAIEDAGFEVRDQILWVYGSGFPKSLDVSKAIDKAAGEARQVINKASDRTDDGTVYGIGHSGNLTSNQPITPAAKQWQGWGTALKPAHEPICVARKPLAKGLTVAANVLEHGTGALNIDGCRVEGRERTEYGLANATRSHGNTYGEPSAGADFDSSKGRWPANLIHSGLTEEWARYFYCAKASKKDRDAGLENFASKARQTMGSGIGGQPDQDIANNKNIHPTVKPTDLMRYLCRLVTPPGGTVLDPFMGSGSTGKAAVLEGFKFVGIEMDESYHTIAKARIEAACVSLFADMI